MNKFLEYMHYLHLINELFGTNFTYADFQIYFETQKEKKKKRKNPAS